MEETIIISLESLRNREYPKISKGVNAASSSKHCSNEQVEVSLEDYVGINPKYGELDVLSINIPIILKESYKNNGIFTSFDYTEFDEIIESQINEQVRDRNLSEASYYDDASPILSGTTDDKLDLVRNYSGQYYPIGYNCDNTPSRAYTAILDINNEYIEYVTKAEVDGAGLYVEGTGIKYKTYFEIIEVIDQATNESRSIQRTEFSFKVKGKQEYDFGLKAIVKEEKYSNISEAPFVQSEVFVDRGSSSIMEKHLRLREIRSLSQMERYNFSFYNVINS